MRVLSVIFIVLLSCGSPEEKSARTPNIIFLFADDYTYSAIGALDNNVVKTPNLDRLVQTGTTFPRTYNMGGWNGAICIASRSMMISGRSLWNARELEEKWKQNDPEEVEKTWGKLLEAGGYATRMTGKWHVKVPADQVFQEARNVRPGMPPDRWTTNNDTWRNIRDAYAGGDEYKHFMPVGYNRPTDEPDLWSPSDTIHGGYWSGGKHWSEVVKDDAVDFIEQSATSDDPFFMYLAFNAPHDPRQAPQSYVDLYPTDSIPLPDNWLPEYPDKDSIGCDPSLRDEALAPFPRTPHAIRTHISEYYAIITHLDAQIGEILQALEASGEMDQTYIIFSADHGLSVGHHGLIGKQSMYEHSIRIPLIISGPGIPENKVLQHPVYLQDIFPTVLELAQIEVPGYVEFNSLLPLVNGERDNTYYQNGIYGAYMDYQRAIISDEHKLILYPRISSYKLFNLTTDPLEMNDLADDPKNRELVIGMFNDLLDIQEQYNDPLDLEAVYPNLSL